MVLKYISTMLMEDSLLSGLRVMSQVLKNKTTCLVGSRDNINLWLDNLCGHRFADLLQVPSYFHCKLNSKTEFYHSKQHFCGNSPKLHLE